MTSVNSNNLRSSQNIIEGAELHGGLDDSANRVADLLNKSLNGGCLEAMRSDEVRMSRGETEQKGSGEDADGNGEEYEGWSEEDRN